MGWGLYGSFMGRIGPTLVGWGGERDRGKGQVMRRIKTNTDIST